MAKVVLVVIASVPVVAKYEMSEKDTGTSNLYGF